LYQQSLALAADLPEARAGLKGCPPDPPMGLHAEPAAGCIRLRWKAPAPDGLRPPTFVIARKTNGAIRDQGDGTRMSEVAGTEFEDRSVTPGSSFSYAVASKRGEVESLTAATTPPIVVLGEVADVRVATRSREVDLSWSLPPQALGVRVVRKRDGLPQGPDDGKKVEALRDQAHDGGLEDDAVYQYGLFAVYRLSDGRLATSRGVFVAARPHPPVEPLAAPSLAQGRDGRIRLSWREPARGSVKVLRTSRPPAQAPGERLTAAEADALEGHWLDVTASDHAEDPTPPALGVCYYTPWTAWAGTLTVGQGVMFSCVADPSDLRAVRVGGGGRVRLRWRWSPHGAQALVVCKAGSPPFRPDDPGAVAELVQEEEYSRQGHFTLHLAASPRGPWHICVYSVATVQGERVFSPGLDPTARTVVPGASPEVTVSYTFRRPRLPGRRWSVEFRTEPRGATIPPTALVAHRRTVPLSVDDGEIVERFPAGRDGASFPIPAAIDLARQRARIFADPHADPDGLPPIRLRHPESAGTRV
jgi:hypothetical protein